MTTIQKISLSGLDKKQDPKNTLDIPRFLVCADNYSKYYEEYLNSIGDIIGFGNCEGFGVYVSSKLPTNKAYLIDYRGTVLYTIETIL